MAKIKPISSIQSISQKIDKTEEVSFRYRNGQTETYHWSEENKNRPFTRAQLESQQRLALAHTQATRILADPALRAQYETLYATKPGKYKTLRGFICAIIMRELKQNEQ